MQAGHEDTKDTVSISQSAFCCRTAGGSGPGAATALAGNAKHIGTHGFNISPVALAALELEQEIVEGFGPAGCYTVLQMDRHRIVRVKIENLNQPTSLKPAICLWAD